MTTSIGITEQNRKAVAKALSILLADEFVLYTKTRNAHWNVEGIDFNDKHLFFEGQYQQLDEIADNVAERIRTLGHYAPGTLSDFLKLTHLSEKTGQQNNSKGFIKELLEDHESIIVFIRKNITDFDDKYKDAGSSDFITGLIKEHEKIAWMLRASLNK